jgi:hypothetical protein
MEYNIQKYQFHQNGKDYVVSTGLVGDKIRITCQEDLTLEGPFYSNEFSLYDLRAANQFFRLTQTPQDALIEINKGIERQKTALKEGTNNTMIFMGYLIIGTDNDIYNLVLRRDFEPNRYGIFTPPTTNASDLVLATNYKVDGERLKSAEANEGDLQREQTVIEEELSNAIPEINKMKKISIDIEEENALIKERIKILQKQLEQRKYNVIRLKQENATLKKDNENLNAYIRNQENIIRDKQAMQDNVKIQVRPNINHGTSAVTSRFEQPALRTFLSRAGAKPTTEEYSQMLNYTVTTPTPNTIISPTTYVQTQYAQYPQTQYIPASYGTTPQIVQTVYQQPQIIVQPPQNLAPSFNYTPNKQLRNSNYSMTTNASYNNPTYRAYLNKGSREVVFKNRVNTPDLDKNRNIKKDLQNSFRDNNINNINKDVPYTSSANKKLNTEIPLSSQYSKPNININNDTLNSIKRNKEKIDNYNSKMGISNTLNNSNNDINYNSQMANISGKIWEGPQRPKGSRMPKANYGNYSGEQYGSNKKSNHNKAPDVGYSSYKPNN